MFIRHSVNDETNHTVYIGTPAWGNYEPMCRLVGLETKTYRHYDPATGLVDFESVMSAVRTASRGSIFILQACCHNPTSADLSIDQWHDLIDEISKRGLIPFFDIAYQGMGKGLDEDVYGVRYAVEKGLELFVCQSFSKNFGLYGERVGALHVLCGSKRNVRPVHDQLRCLIRWEFSSSPAYGSRLVNQVLSDEDNEASWVAELAIIRARLHSIREKFSHMLNNVYQVPGDWSVVTQGSGLFSLLPLTPDQCRILQKECHIYMVPNGRITISGLTDTNMDYVAKCIDSIVRRSVN
ncbi:unnamed protein product [Penicillium salamii]|nr:unnamed protein product [Penicillium salamii]